MKGKTISQQVKESFTKYKQMFIFEDVLKISKPTFISRMKNNDWKEEEIKKLKSAKIIN